MTKVYKARTDLSVNIVLPSGFSRYVSFVPATDGSSWYRTNDEDIMWGLEHHYRYGELFFGHFVEEAKPRVVEAPEDETETRRVEVADLAEAKDYLADKFGVSRTMLRGEKSIMAQAEANGVTFVIKENN